MENRDSVVANLERLRDEMKSGSVRTTVGASGVVRRMDWLDDAIAMLQAQKPHLITAMDFENNPNVDDLGRLAGWLETRPGAGEEFEREGWVTINKLFMENNKYRVWTGKPSEQQKREEKWE